MTRDEISIKVREAVAEELGLDPSAVSESSTIEELGIDSLDVVSIACSLEDSLGMQDLDTHLVSDRHETIGDFIQVLRDLLPED